MRVDNLLVDETGFSKAIINDLKKQIRAATGRRPNVTYIKDVAPGISDSAIFKRLTDTTVLLTMDRKLHQTAIANRFHSITVVDGKLSYGKLDAVGVVNIDPYAGEDHQAHAGRRTESEHFLSGVAAALFGEKMAKRARTGRRKIAGATGSIQSIERVYLVCVAAPYQNGIAVALQAVCKAKKHRTETDPFFWHLAGVPNGQDWEDFLLMLLQVWLTIYHLNGVPLISIELHCEVPVGRREISFTGRASASPIEIQNEFFKEGLMALKPAFEAIAKEVRTISGHDLKDRGRETRFLQDRLCNIIVRKDRGDELRRLDFSEISKNLQVYFTSLQDR